jgi:two-component system phosphate regulon sensor histidine kinase PhoR
LFNIQGYVSTLLSGAIENPDVNRKYLEKTEANIDRMVAMVEELGLISGLETGELRLNASKFSIQSLALEVINHLEDQASIKNITLSLAADNPVTFMVVADRDKYRQVFTNLLSNSIRYGIQNGRTKISFYDMGENILVEVSDNGIGVDTQHLSRLFERFYRVDKSRAREDGGSGLGLAIVKHIVEAHEQTVNVRSTPGLGSTFSFTVRKA